MAAVNGNIQTSDTLLTLISLGFDIEECQSLLEKEDLTVERAVERLLTAKSDTQQTKQQETQKIDLIPDSVNSASSNKTPKDEPHLSSRLSCSKEQQHIKYGYRLKEAEVAAQNAKRRRVQDKLARQSVLEEIKADRKHCKEIRGHSIASAATIPESKPQDAASSSQQSSSMDNMYQYHVKIKLPSGESLSHHFSKETTLNDILLFCNREQPGLQDCVVLQPFPRREFKEEDASKSLEELSLPSSVLLILVPRNVNTLQKEDRLEAADDSQGRITCSSSSATDRDAEGSSPNVACNDDSSARGSVASGDPVFRGLINAISTSSNVLDLSSSNTVNAGNETENRPGRRLCDASDDRDKPTNSEHEDEPLPLSDRNAIRGAAERRLQRQLASCSITTSETSSKSNPLERTLPSLQNICADCIALSLAGKKSQILSNMGKLSPSAAERVLQYLMKRKFLSGRILNAFLSCKLLGLDFSFYPLTSNEILESARFHKALIHLNLSLCSLITDQGLTTAVKGLPNLRYLKLNDCCHISDKSLNALSNLHHLTSLSLDGTKVTDKGVSSFLNCCSTNLLMELSLKRTVVSQVGLLSDRGFVGLVGALAYGVYAYKNRGPAMTTSRYLMRLRVLAQSCVVGSICVGVAMASPQNETEKKK